ncbi:uncharacterized protein EV420DRAFT_1750287 [Desarmillaria tabescens]|uniref:Uncharacterized protein n=1 Tax=Armillaria tabescens TaxID=1929756 RepID=A0AA39MY49_ARMTA|nr:uncharacterized protein EV420DRAFT_1750287 [Desarmillaria tabescens]KAK0450468.1 hypothetical protein EV420DRAFT_1750287 [Desarmillaria tabescens]
MRGEQASLSIVNFWCSTKADILLVEFKLLGKATSFVLLFVSARRRRDGTAWRTIGLWTRGCWVIEKSRTSHAINATCHRTGSAGSKSRLFADLLDKVSESSESSVVGLISSSQSKEQSTDRVRLHRQGSIPTNSARSGITVHRRKKIDICGRHRESLPRFKRSESEFCSISAEVEDVTSAIPFITPIRISVPTSARKSFNEGEKGGAMIHVADVGTNVMLWNNMAVFDACHYRG